jgi:predicted outer membrane protein
LRLDDDTQRLVIALHQQTIDLLNRLAAYQIEAARLRQEAATARKRVKVCWGGVSHFAGKLRQNLGKNLISETLYS